jgi:hypothetical protein
MDELATIRDSVINEIRAVFNGVLREDGVSMHEAEVIDAYGSDEQRARARSRDTELDWENIGAQDIERHSQILPFLDPKGFRYYLPAYMVWALQNFGNSDSLSVDNTIYALQLPAKRNLREWQLERFKAFNRKQAYAILRFLRFMVDYSRGYADEGAAYDAITGYWNQFATADS